LDTELERAVKIIKTYEKEVFIMKKVTNSVVRNAIIWAKTAFITTAVLAIFASICGGGSAVLFGRASFINGLLSPIALFMTHDGFRWLAIIIVALMCFVVLTISKDLDCKVEETEETKGNPFARSNRLFVGALSLVLIVATVFTVNMIGGEDESVNTVPVLTETACECQQCSSGIIPPSTSKSACPRDYSPNNGPMLFAGAYSNPALGASPVGNKIGQTREHRCESWCGSILPVGKVLLPLYCCQ
jgi:hypothetical protein